MVKKGLVKIQFHSFECSRIKHNICKVRLLAADVELVTQVPSKEQDNNDWHYLPNSDKFIFEMLGQNEEIGYF
jgi:hypothetical protein